MKSLSLGRLSLLAVLLFASRRLALADEDKNLLVGGESVGQVRLGMKEDQIINVLGKPPYKDAIGDTAWDDWYSKPSEDSPTEEINIIFRHEDRQHPGQWYAWQVTITSPSFHTATGISTRSDVGTIWREFPDLRYATTEGGGDGSRLELYDSPSRGIAFLIERTEHPHGDDWWGKCRGIIVHRPGEGAMFDRIGKPNR